MRLNRLHIENYKNLKDLTLDFETGHGLTMLIGNNGSGKSNVLEAISGIYHDAYIGNNQRRILTGPQCRYSISYELSGNICEIRRENNALRFYVAEEQIGRDAFIHNNMPNNVIGIYSGEEDRLWTNFFEHFYRAYINRIKSDLHQEHMKLMFINKYYWNISLLALLLSENETLAPFIDNELHIKSVNKIVLSYSQSHYAESENASLKAFIDRINPGRESYVKYSIEQLREMIFYDQWVDSDGKAITDTNGSHILLASGITDAQVFAFFTQAFMPKTDKMITDIEIQINDEISAIQLSEGEKKLILVKTVLEIVADEKTLLLFDEPDAHLHEGRKSRLYDIMLEYPNRQIVLATHSPVLAQCGTDGQLILMEDNDGIVKPIPEEKIKKIRKLTDGIWGVLEQSMALSSNKPLVIFEGKTDVLYVKRAFELLRQGHEKYRSINVDFINANGAGNAKAFIDNLVEIIPASKKLVVFFDRDDAGKKGAAAVAEISKDDERILHFEDVVKENITVSFIPYKEGITDGDFLIEDYFSWDRTIKAIIEDSIPDRHHPIRNLPNLPTKIKSSIEDRYSSFEADEFNGFIALLDKIYELADTEGEA